MAIFRLQGGKFTGMQLTDDAILEVIRDCETRDGRARGVAVRQALFRTHGKRASTDRIYRLLRQHEQSVTAADHQSLQARIQGLEKECRRLREELAEQTTRAALAEHREQAHLSKWASELHELREKVSRYESLHGMRSAAQEQKAHLQLLIELTRARQDIARFQQLLEQHGIALDSDPD
jgi:hypothetical protein